MKLTFTINNLMHENLIETATTKNVFYVYIYNHIMLKSAFFSSFVFHVSVGNRHNRQKLGILVEIRPHACCKFLNNYNLHNSIETPKYSNRTVSI